MELEGLVIDVAHGARQLALQVDDRTALAVLDALERFRGVTAEVLSAEVLNAVAESLVEQ